MITLNLQEAKKNLSRLVARVEAGEEVVICRGRIPVVELVRYPKSKAVRPRVGEITSKPIKCHPDCFEPLSDT